MDWREIYARRLCTPEQAAALIAPGDRIFAGGAGSFPAVLIDAVSDRAELRGIPVVTVVNGTESRALSDPVCFARTPYHSLFLGRADRKFQQRGGLHENSVQFHQTVRAAREVYRVNTLMLEVSEPDADGYLYYGPRGTAWSSLDTQVEKDSIGKRYRRQDAIGTPFCITVDHQTLEDRTVTVRHRDSMEQQRVAIADLPAMIGEEVSLRKLFAKLN